MLLFWLKVREQKNDSFFFLQILKGLFLNEGIKKKNIYKSHQHIATTPKGSFAFLKQVDFFEILGDKNP